MKTYCCFQASKNTMGNMIHRQEAATDFGTYVPSPMLLRLRLVAVLRSVEWQYHSEDCGWCYQARSPYCCGTARTEQENVLRIYDEAVLAEQNATRQGQSTLQVVTIRKMPPMVLFDPSQ